MTSYLSTEVTGPRCFDCGETLVSTNRDGCAVYAHPSSRDDHAPRVAFMPVHAGPPVAHIVDRGTHFAAYVDDRVEGRPWRLLGTAPTGRGAAYQDARDRGYAEGLATVEGWVSRYGVVAAVEYERDVFRAVR